MAQFVWISSAILYFLYFKANSSGPNSENKRFLQRKFWDISSVTDIYHISKNKDFLRPSLSTLPDSYRKWKNPNYNQTSGEFKGKSIEKRTNSNEIPFS